MGKQVFRKVDFQSPFSSTGECWEVTEEKVMKYQGLEFTVKTRYYRDKETGEEFTTGEQDQEWWDDLKRQYFEYLSATVSDASCLEILEFMSPLVIFKNPWEKGPEKFKAINTNLNLEFLEDEKKTLEFMIGTHEMIGSGRTPLEAVKDLYIKLGK